MGVPVGTPAAQQHIMLPHPVPFRIPRRKMAEIVPIPSADPMGLLFRLVLQGGLEIRMQSSTLGPGNIPFARSRLLCPALSFIYLLPQLMQMPEPLLALGGPTRFGPYPPLVPSSWLRRWQTIVCVPLKLA